MLILLFVLGLGLSIGYVLLISEFMDGWNKSLQQSNPSVDHVSSVSIIVPFRNEEKNLPALIKSIQAIDFPLNRYQIIFVNNNSSDQGVDYLEKQLPRNAILLHQPMGFKKESIELGIQQASGDVILMTDADVILSPLWIQDTLDHMQKNNSDVVLGPVEIVQYKNVLTRFQALDMLAMMGTTVGGIKKDMLYLGNGANLAIKRSCFDAIKEIPFKQLRSGDDIFLIHELKKMGFNISFNLSQQARVKTYPVRSWKKLIQQRIRWASKSMSYVRKKDKHVNAFIFIFVLSIFIQFCLIPWTQGLSFFIAIFQLFIKGCIDFAFLVSINEFFKKKHLLSYFLPSFFIFNLYILFAGVSAMIKPKYSWKDEIGS